MNASLIESYDISISKLSPEQKLAISHKGKAHLDLASKNSVFFYQMALTTYITDRDVAESIRSVYKTEQNFPTRISKIKSVFATYLLDEDAKFINSAVTGDQFVTQQNLLLEIEKFKEGDFIRLKKGERHRLVGLEDFCVVAEIWQHTDSNNPSDENDIIRVQDDFGRN